MPSSLDDYEVICTVGSGSYGICQKIRRKRDGKVLVWKELDYGEMSESEKQLLVSEVNLLRELKHEHIVRYYDRIIDRPHTRLYIIMEYCEGGDLSTLIASLKKNGGHCEEDFVWRICVQTVNALCECHSRSSKLGKAVLHRDLKPANVFLDANRNVKLGDFGLARVLNHDTSFAKTFVGTPYYMSPELMNYMSYNEKSDIWSLGCLLYELCALKPPFTASSQTELASKVRVGHFSRLPLRYSNDLNTVISFMLQVDEEKRPSVEALADHKLIVKHDPNRQHTPVASPPINGTHKTRPESGASDEGYGSHAKSLQRREEMLEKRQEDLLARIKALEEKEKLLREREKASEDKEKKIMKFMLKEKELEAREKTVQLREKMVDDKMAKVEKILAAADKSSLMSPRDGSIMTPSYTDYPDASPLDMSPPVSSCLIKGDRSIDSPKKHVSFHVDKENFFPVQNRDLYCAETQLQAEHYKHMQDLRERLKKAEKKSVELKKTDSNLRVVEPKVDKTSVDDPVDQLCHVLDKADGDFVKTFQGTGIL